MSVVPIEGKPLSDPYAPSQQPLDSLSMVQQAMSRAEDTHTAWVEKIEARYRAYRGLAEQRNEAQDPGRNQGWRSKLTTPYLLQMAEGMLSTMLDPNPSWDVKPRPRPGESLEEVVQRGQSVRVAKAALGSAMAQDHFHLKQRPFMQQDLIAGATVGKVVWEYEAREMSRLRETEYEVVDWTGSVIDRYRAPEETSGLEVLRDGPSLIVRDVRDFFWPESAKTIKEAAWVIDRTWATHDELLQKQKAGIFRNVDELIGAEGAPPAGTYSERELELWNKNRAAGLIEVLEYWTDERLVTVGGRAAVLSDGKNPTNICRKPFVMCSSMPDAFQMVGISVIEVLAQLQEYLWTIQNQRIDALRLLTNVITLIRSDVDDPDAFEFYPGAQWMVEDPGQVGQLEIDPTAAQITLEAEALIKGDLQNMLGGLPMAGGVSSGSIDQETATGMSIITSIAQKMIQARKQQYSWAWGEIGELFLSMMGQMIRTERVISQLGPGGTHQLVNVHPLHLQGDFDVNVNVMDESTIRQEDRSEKMALVNMLVPLAALGVNPRPAIEMALGSYGIEDTDRFFSAPAGPPGAPPGGPPGGTPQGAAGIQEGMGGGGGPLGSGGQTNPALAAMMGGGAGGLAMSPDQFATQQLSAVQQVNGMGAN